MKRYIFILIVLIKGGFYVSGQSDDSRDLAFTYIKKLDATPVKNQNSTSTCWSFSVLSMLESELLLMGKGTYDLSEMFIVRNTYIKKAEKYIRMHGNISFSGGGALNDVIDIIKTCGIVPEAIYDGKKIDAHKHIHGEMDEVLKDYLDGVLKNSNHGLSKVWMEGFCGILDAYLGKVPSTFDWKDKTSNATSYSSDLGLDMNDYILISSFTHHPFYEQFGVEVPDNWSWGQAYNVPLDEMIEIIHFSLMNNHTVAWAADISDKGFSYSGGIAVVSDTVPTETLDDVENIFTEDHFKRPIKEKTVTQEMRQEAFDNYLTTDDHGMQITGIAEDQDGHTFYYVKNSWGTVNPYQGYLFVSEQYIRYKTLTILVNKNALPDDIKNKLKFYN
jgi:bleomycin hydrolase